MKENIQKQLELLSNKYGWLPKFTLKNMRLMLLILFALMAGYLVNRINSLVNGDGIASTETNIEQASTSSLSKTPDAEVISTFNELSVQNVTLDSSFEPSRDNPF